jgi:multisubunit Na+/H+ antiporter MnhB subunit
MPVTALALALAPGVAVVGGVTRGSSVALVALTVTVTVTVETKCRI